jgi:hypothetical protein
MFYCGLDVAGLSSYGYVMDAEGRKLWAGAVATEKKALAERLRRFVRGGLTVAIEAGNQTAWVYETLVALGAKVVVVNPNKVKLIAESRRKTDKIDAKILCELLRLGGLPEPVHMPGRETRALRGLLVARRQLVAARTKVCNVVRGLLRQEGVRLPANALSSQLLRHLPEPDEVDSDFGAGVGGEGKGGRACQASQDDAEGGTDRRLDVRGRGGRRAAVCDRSEAGGLLGLGAERACQRRTHGVRLDQSCGPPRVAGGLGADRPPGGQ